MSNLTLADYERLDTLMHYARDLIEWIEEHGHGANFPSDLIEDVEVYLEELSLLDIVE